MTEVEIRLTLTEYEASILTGALLEFDDSWDADGDTAVALRRDIMVQLPTEWTC